MAYVPKDGPLPEMYEPVESPVENILAPEGEAATRCSSIRASRSHQPIGTVADFPYVLMTSTVAEHWCAGSTTRNIPWLNELVPEPVIEIPVSLAQKLAVKSGDWVKVSSARGELTVKALVTPRMKTLKADGQEVTIVWMPYNWGFKGLSTGPSVNHLTIDAVDPGAGTQETKACLVNVVKFARGGARSVHRAKGKCMSQAANTGSIKTDADRHHEMHRLSGVPGCLQAVERSRWRRDRVSVGPWFSEPRYPQRKNAYLNYVSRGA